MKEMLMQTVLLEKAIAFINCALLSVGLGTIRGEKTGVGPGIRIREFVVPFSSITQHVFQSNWTQ